MFEEEKIEALGEDRYKNDKYNILFATDQCKKEIINSYENNELTLNRLNQIKKDFSELITFIINDNKPRKVVSKEAKEAFDNIENWLVNKKILPF
jgi:hypothetical protein